MNKEESFIARTLSGHGDAAPFGLFRGRLFGGLCMRNPIYLTHIEERSWERIISMSQCVNFDRALPARDVGLLERASLIPNKLHWPELLFACPWSH